MKPMEKLEKLGLKLAAAPKPLASYVPAVRTGNLIFVSGQLPVKEGKILYSGKIEKDCSMEQAVKAAEICAMNCLSAALTCIESLDSIERIVSVCGYCNCQDGFSAPSQVINGASDFLTEIFGEKGKHSRAAIGVSGLPLNAAVEISMVIEVK